MRVCVIGAGIVGCATAYELARRGAQVRLVDAAPEPGTATSFANGAQLSYSYVEPFASPGTLRMLPHVLTHPASPIKFRLRADWRQWSWGLRFLRACTAASARRGTEQLLALARLSRETLEDWMAAEPWSFDFERNGKLVLCPDAQSLAHQRAQVALQATLGSRQQVLTPAQCLEHEPGLAQARVAFAGGVWTPDECVADPFLLCRELLASLRRLGGQAAFGSAVDGFVRRGERVVAARTAGGEIEADAFVLAAGPQAAALGAAAGVSLPIYPIKGYSVTLPYAGAARPRASVTHLGLKTVFAPLGDRLRVAAMAEVGYDGVDVPPDRLRAMLDSVEALYPGMCGLQAPSGWAGLRPATPDSLPIVGRHRASNLFINAGHGALGLTLAAGCAVRLAQAILQPA